MGFVAIVLGMPYRLFFPVFIDRVYDAGPVGLGMMGLFIGAIVLGLGYKFFQVWIQGDKTPEAPVEAPLGA